MRKLALTDDILMKIEKPARYIGNEVNSVMKDKTKVDIRFAMCFPDVYEIGMSHLGIQILYDMFNRREDVWCERVYSPWTDLDAVMREKKIPLFALESQDPIKNFDFLGITIQYEMCYTNILQILDLSGIPIKTKDRTEEDPIVIGGGPCTYNPEPLADFFDLFYMGEGETVYDELLDLYKKNKAAGGSRWDFLEMAAEVEGIYIPSFYDVEYKEDGTILSFTPNNVHAKEKIKKQVVMDMSSAPYPEKPVVPFIKATQDRVVLEIQRGCIRGCRFCQAGFLYRPFREKSVETINRQAKRLCETTGYDEISLSSLSTSDYSRLFELLDTLHTWSEDERVSVSLPSLRVDNFSTELIDKIASVRKSGLTFAPEAGTQRMRDVINKNVTEEELKRTVQIAFNNGWSKVKLYFMIGLPTESDEDVVGIPGLGQKVVDWYYETENRQKGRKVAVTVSAAAFVPKPFTPFQWFGQDTIEMLERKQKLLRESTFSRKLTVNYHGAETSFLEAVFARGDRKLNAVILEAHKRGMRFDGWADCFDFDAWMQVFKDLGIDPAFYANRQRSFDEVFPWDHLDYGIKKEFLIEECKRAYASETTPNCREKCSACGAACFKGGLCVEKRC